MITTAGTRTSAHRVTPETTGDPAHGWYLYGITRRGALGELPAPDDGAPVQMLELSGLAAVVGRVRRADFSADALRERLNDASALEAMVRSHNGVIEAIHRRQAILPAKFGLVYANVEDVISALRPAHDMLVDQLDRLAGCDEWAVHLYADPAVIRERTSVADPAIQRLRDARATARPGRAYFLDQQIRDAVEAATQQALTTLAQDAFDRLAGCTVAAELSSMGPGTDLAGEAEILRASFLVARDGAERFMEDVSYTVDLGHGLRCETSGPWPPYSFATWNDGEGL